MESREHNVLLAIADISGYTRFMTANAKTLAHSQIIITSLIERIIETVASPLSVAKLEGDAAFFYCLTDTEDWADPAIRERVRGQIMGCAESFEEKRLFLRETNTCLCDACTGIEQLRLKVVAHAGTALLHRVATTNELSSVDVITVHKLLKNSVDGDEYVLLTDSAFEALDISDPSIWQQGSEEYEGLGSLPVHVHFPRLEDNPPHSTFLASSLPQKLNLALRQFLRFALMAQPRVWGLVTPETFRNLPSGVSLISRVGQSVLLLTTTPLVLLIGVPIVVGRAVLSHVRRPTDQT